MKYNSQKYITRFARRTGFLGFAFLFLSFAFASQASAAIVINEVYGGAGCGTAGCSTYQRDFVEVKNTGATTVDVTGFSVQYAAATGTAWQVTILNGFIAPGGTYLIGEGSGANGVTPLPTPNSSGTIAMSATAGKVALVNNSTALTGACPTGATILDLVGYGASANCNEGGTNAPSPSTTASVARNVAGTDTNVNGTDFTTGAPTPQSFGVTAADAVISGRITNSRGRGLGSVRVKLTGGSLTEPRYATTTSFGYYQFAEVESGDTYILEASSRRYHFAQPTIVVTLNESFTAANFVGDEWGIFGF